MINCAQIWEINYYHGLSFSLLWARTFFKWVTE